MWAITDANDEWALMLVFGDDGQFAVYRYDIANELITQNVSTRYEATATGYKVKDGNDTWHFFDTDPENGSIAIDGDSKDMTYVNASFAEEIARKLCVGACAIASCASFPIGCCSCCFCMHACADISFMDWICCFYLGGCG